MDIDKKREKIHQQLDMLEEYQNQLPDDLKRQGNARASPNPLANVSQAFSGDKRVKIRYRSELNGDK